MKNAGQKNETSKWLAAGAAILGLGAVLALAAAPALADVSPEVQQACTPDVMRLCNEFVPDVAKITACMNRNRRYVSAACANAIHPPRATRHAYVVHHHSHH